MFKLREYQEKAVSSVLNCWQQHASCLVVLPTGCGKTVVFGEIARRLLAPREYPPAEGCREAGAMRGAPQNNLCSSAPLRFAEGHNRIMILAHRQELITQAQEKVAAITGVDVQIEMGEYRATPLFGKAPPVVVSTVQTQCAGRMQNFDPMDFAALIIDEAHHATSDTYRKCIDWYRRNPNLKVLGVTATPDRADEMALGTVFEAVAFEYTHREATEDGWLVPIRQELVKVDTLDFSNVSVSAGDLNQAELAEVMEEEQNLHAVAAPVKSLCPTDRAIIFATSVRQAERLAEILNRETPSAKHGETEERSLDTAGGVPPDPQAPARSAPKNEPLANGLESLRSSVPPCYRVAENPIIADWISGNTPKEERRQKLQAFREGRTRFMVNVGILTEGFDDAGVNCVVMARPTKSRALYAQMVGRATRPAADIAAKLGTIDGNDGRARSPSAPLSEARCKMIASSSKPYCRVIDFVGNSGRHKLVTTFDILGGKDLDDEVKEETKKVLSEKPDEDVLSALEEAHARIAERKEIEAKRRAFVQATAKFVSIRVDPFNIYDLPPVEDQAPTPGKRLSLRQQEILKEKLHVDPRELSYARAKQLLDEHFRRMSAHQASLPQSKLLRTHGIPVPMSRDEARRTIDKLLKK